MAQPGDMNEKPEENWESASPYERYVGRWSRAVAREFLAWIFVPVGAAWADVGCGTGALVEGILAQCEPKLIACVHKASGFVSATHRERDRSSCYVRHSRRRSLTLDADTFDVTVSGLVSNFVPDHKAMASERARVTRPGGKVAAYVWDYGRGMEMMRHFWDAAIAVSPG